ncbi:MAG: hypothetical protein M3347_11550 [Armatimonadota bacterium]|nr:hypothetical protein [Armatimonadota bacterium]
MHCLLRGRVRVDAFSDGPVRWPCFNHGGRPGFILCGDLVRALRQEPSLAVQHGWGVRRQTVARWRKILGVARNLRRRHSPQ